MNEVLFTDGDWRIRRTGLHGASSIMHMCKDKFNIDNMWWHIGALDKSCVWCKSNVPDPIMGLFILHNWDRP